eukprot:gene3284-1940_t
MTGEGVPKFCQLRDYIASFGKDEGMRPPFIPLTETHLHPLEHPEGLVEIPGYTMLRCDRDPAISRYPSGKVRRKQGGAACYIRRGVEYTDSTTKCGEDFEGLAFSTGTTRIVVLYRPPGEAVSETLLDWLRAERDKSPMSGTVPGRFLVLGDLNMNWQAKRPAPAALALLLRKELGLKQYVNFTTHTPVRLKSTARAQPRPSTLDHVWANFTCRCRPIAPLRDVADHEAIQVSYAPVEEGRKAPPHKPTVIYRRQWRQVDPAQVADVVRGAMAPYMAAPTRHQPHEPAQARAEMCASGVGDHDLNVRRSHTAPSRDAGAPIAELQTAWDAAWDEVKRTLAPPIPCEVTRAPMRPPWLMQE